MPKQRRRRNPWPPRPPRRGTSDSGDGFAVHRYYQRELDSYDLTPRERNVVLMTLEGLRAARDIGENRRMRAHRESACKSAYAKLGVANRKELMDRFALL